MLKDFIEYEKDPLFKEIMRRLDQSKLNESDRQFIIDERDLWEQVDKYGKDLFEDGEKAQALLYKNGFTIMSVRDVLVADIQDKPGELGKFAQKMANAEVNIDFVYLATNTRIVLGVDDIDKAAAA